MYSVNVKYTKFQSIDSEGFNDGKETFGIRVYNTDGQNEYCNTFSTFDEMANEINPITIFDFLHENFEEMFNTVEEEGGLCLNSEELSLYDEDEDDEEELDTMIETSTKQKNDNNDIIGDIIEDAADSLVTNV